MITAEQVNAHIEKLEAELQGATTAHAHAKAWKACAKKWRKGAENYKRVWQQTIYNNFGLEAELEAARKVIEVARNVYTIQRALAEYDAVVKR